MTPSSTPRRLSRRHFVTLLAAGSAALAAPAIAAPAKRSKPRTRPAPAKPAAPAAPATKSGASAASALQKEFDRQRAGTLATLKTIRDFELPPGGDLPVVFRALPRVKKGR